MIYMSIGDRQKSKEIYWFSKHTHIYIYIYTKRELSRKQRWEIKNLLWYSNRKRERGKYAMKKPEGCKGWWMAGSVCVLLDMIYAYLLCE